MSAMEDPQNPKVAASVFDLLLIELVPLAYRINADITARDEAAMSESSRQHLFPRRKHPARRPPDRTAPRDTNTSTQGGNASTDANPATTDTGIGADAEAEAEISSTSAITHDPPRANSTATTQRGNSIVPLQNTPSGHQDPTDLNLETYDPDPSTRELAQARILALGYRLGQGLAESYSTQLPARPGTQLECIKFICKDVWTRVFRKQVDNLKTNHRGTFVLTDNRFGPVARVSMDRKLGGKGVERGMSRVQTLLWFPCGIIRGALAGLGMHVEVQADCVELPVAVFQIRSVGAKT